MNPVVGDALRDFELSDQHGRRVRLSEVCREGHVALVFYPFAFSGICAGELCELRDNIKVFEDRNVQLVGVSCDPMWTLRAFAETEGYGFPLLSDFWPHGEVARQYGVFNDDLGFAIRGTFLIDRDGILRWSVVNGPGEARSLAAYKDAVEAL